MYATLLAVARHHDARLVAVAGLICFLSCYTALTLVARAGKPGATSSDPWLTASTVVIGCGVWAVHFVTLLAFEPNMRMGYDPGSALLAAGTGIVCSGLGFAVVIRRHSTIGGAMVGAAAAAMNYVVMAALRLPAHEHWDSAYVIMSFVVGIGFGSASLTLSRRRSDWAGQLTAALLMTFGALGAHFLGMAALSLTPDPSIAVPSEMIPPIWFSVAVTAICILIIGLVVIGSLVDQHIVELEATKRNLEQTTDLLRLAVKDAAAADETKSQFLASMSHELRTPLNAILGFSEMLKEPGSQLEGARVRAYAANIFDSGTHLLALINDVLDISKLDAGHLELNNDAVDVGELVASSVHLMEGEARKLKVRLDAAVPRDLPRLLADERRLRQVLLNLLSNALKFTPENGRVHVAVSREREGLAIAVSDTGIGMSAADIPIAFERFGQIDSKLSRRHTGTGLGLPLSRHLVELHEGRLDVASQPGAGTTMTIMIPCERILQERQAA
ncbi:MAG TPA: ATP-binding protein [Rhizomicrobium sp.]